MVKRNTSSTSKQSRHASVEVRSVRSTSSTSKGVLLQSSTSSISSRSISRRFDSRSDSFWLANSRSELFRPKSLFDAELIRQALHLVIGVILALLVFHEVVGIFGLVVLLLCGFVLSALLLEYRLFFLSWFLERFERKEDQRMPGKGALFMLLGAVVVTGFFSSRIAAASLLVLAVGDSVSHLSGKYFGSRPHPLNPKKLWEGTVWGTIAATFATALIVPLWAAFFASAVAMFFEAIEWRVKGALLSDNILVPLVAALVLTLIL